MPFPITISSTAKATEAPGSYGLFAASGSLYSVGYFTVALHSRIAMFKSTDLGTTWAEVDSGNRPSVAESGANNFSVCQSTADSTKIIATYGNDIGNVAATVFNTGTDTWGVESDSGSFGGLTYVSCYRASDNSVIVAMGGVNGATIHGFFHLISSFIVLSLSGMTWSGVTDLSYSDYSPSVPVTAWNQQPCGIVCDTNGVVHVFMQQVTTFSDGSTITQDLHNGDTTFACPPDCISATVECWGAGAGGGNVQPIGVGNGGGGGGGYRSSVVDLVPGTVYAVTVGAGGAPGADGNDTTFAGLVTAGKGFTATGAFGGGGGSGSNAGGAGGGSTAIEAGGGGGGAGSPSGAGGTGGDAFITSSPTVHNQGGPGGTSGSGAGGAGGSSPGPYNPNGGAGTSPGGGGGGSCGLAASVAGAGADGLIRITYVSTFANNPGRIWQQSIDATNTPGSLTEIAEGQFNTNNGAIQFDAKAGSGYVAIAFSGAIATLNDQISVGKASNASTLAFTFSSFNVGNSGSQIQSSPSLALNGSEINCVYMSAPTADGDCTFLYRKGSGSFGAPATIGTFADAGARILASFLNGTLYGAFATPTTAAKLVTGDEGSPDFLTFTANVPGVSGNNITINLVGVLNGSDALDVTVVDYLPEGHVINLSYGYSMPDPDTVLLVAGTWSAFAALVNGSVAGNYVNTIGYTGTVASTLSANDNLSGGTSGGNANTTYFFAVAAPVPAIIKNYGGSSIPLPLPRNRYDMCLAQEWKMYDAIDREKLSCARKPDCFIEGTKPWDDAPRGALTINPSKAIPLPAAVDGNVTIFSTRVPFGFDGILLAHFHLFTGNFQEGSGDLAWRIRVNGRYLLDCGNMLVTIGSNITLSPIHGGLWVLSGNLVEYVVEAPNGGGSLPLPGQGNILAGLHGYWFPRL